MTIYLREITAGRGGSGAKRTDIVDVDIAEDNLQCQKQGLQARYFRLREVRVSQFKKQMEVNANE